MNTENVTLHQTINVFMERYQLDPDFREASEHPYDCRCAKCLMWWIWMGADPVTGRHGPFDPTELQAAESVTISS
jgi:hypothetical protein